MREFHSEGPRGTRNSIEICLRVAVQEISAGKVCWAAHLHTVVRTGANLTCDMRFGMARFDFVSCGEESLLSDQGFRRYEPFEIQSLAGVAHLHIVVRNCNCEMTIGIARFIIWEAKLGRLRLRAMVQKLLAKEAFQRERFCVSFRRGRTVDRRDPWGV